MSKIVIDVKPPHRQPPKTTAAAKIAPEKRPEIPTARNRRLKKILLTTTILVSVVITISFIQIFSFQDRAEASLIQIKQDFKNFAGALSSFNLTEAKKSLARTKATVTGLQRSSYLARFWGLTIPKLKNVGSALDQLDNLTDSLMRLNADLEDLKDNAFHWLTNYGGGDLLAKLQSLADDLVEIVNIGENLKTSAEALEYENNDWPDLAERLSSANGFINQLIEWLDSSEPRHLVLLFQNPSEIRPTGGFIGSYAELTLDRASLANIKVWDIYDPDGQLVTKITPPRPLQFVTSTWGARDANWFFDFPTSADKVMTMLENSKIYSERDVQFSGAVAINTNVIASILTITGPIYLEEYDLTIDQHNFLAEIQKEVESGADKKAGEPKRILKVMMPLLFGELANLPDSQQATLWREFNNHVAAKDIMVYLRDADLENYLKSFGLAGEISATAKDYLAVVNANIAGGKTDAFIKQTLVLNIKIDDDGNAHHQLVVNREHWGATQSESWYRVDNKDYLQILTPMTSQLTSASGGWLRSPKTERGIAINYEFSLEEFTQFGKKTFATWLITPAGKTKEFNLQYQLPQAMKVAAGEQYKFVFDKQSGGGGTLEINIEAPTGYHWSESNSSIFSYYSDTVPARVTLSLTLLK